MELERAVDGFRWKSRILANAEQSDSTTPFDITMIQDELIDGKF